MLADSPAGWRGLMPCHWIDVKLESLPVTAGFFICAKECANSPAGGLQGWLVDFRGPISVARLSLTLPSSVRRENVGLQGAEGHAQSYGSFGRCLLDEPLAGIGSMVPAGAMHCKRAMKRPIDEHIQRRGLDVMQQSAADLCKRAIAKSSVVSINRG